MPFGSAPLGSYPLGGTTDGSLSPIGLVADSLQISGSVAAVYGICGTASGVVAFSAAVSATYVSPPIYSDVRTAILITGAVVGAQTQCGIVATNAPITVSVAGKGHIVSTVAGGIRLSGAVSGYTALIGAAASAHCAVRLTAAAQGRAGNSGISSVVVAVHGAVEGRHLNPVLLAAYCRIAISVEVCAEVVQKGRDTDAMFVLTAAEQLEVWTDV